MERSLLRGQGIWCAWLETKNSNQSLRQAGKTQLFQMASVANSSMLGNRVEPQVSKLFMMP
jgi:hypothetical protein